MNTKRERERGQSENEHFRSNVKKYAPFLAHYPHKNNLYRIQAEETSTVLRHHCHFNLDQSQRGVGQGTLIVGCAETKYAKTSLFVIRNCHILWLTIFTYYFIPYIRSISFLSSRLCAPVFVYFFADILQAKLSGILPSSAALRGRIVVTLL